MPFREKLKKTFSKKNDSGESTPGNETPPRRTDIEYYEPHEIPRSKYRGKVDKKHQKKLDSFSWADAFSSVRKSSISLSGTFSPGGTKAQSRRPSWMSRTKSSMSTATTTTTAARSDTESKSLRRKSVAASGRSIDVPVKEDDEDKTDSVDSKKN